MPETVLITGAGRGLGFELARLCAARGDRVIATVRSPEGARALHGVPGVEVALLDLANSDAVAGVVDDMAGRADALDVVINNAGVNYRGVPDGVDTLSVETMSAAPMLELFRVNAIAPLLVVRGALPHLLRASRPRVLNISSWLASIGGFEPGAAANYGYRTTKAAVVMATRALAAEVGPQGVTAVAINPGWMQTDMGGERAPLAPGDAAAGILQVADALQVADGGRFIDWDGADHPY